MKIASIDAIHLRILCDAVGLSSPNIERLAAVNAALMIGVSP